MSKIKIYFCSFHDSEKALNFSRTISGEEFDGERVDLFKDIPMSEGSPH